MNFETDIQEISSNYRYFSAIMQIADAETKKGINYYKHNQKGRAVMHFENAFARYKEFTERKLPSHYRIFKNLASENMDELLRTTKKVKLYIGQDSLLKEIFGGAFP